MPETKETFYTNIEFTGNFDNLKTQLNSTSNSFFIVCLTRTQNNKIPLRSSEIEFLKQLLSKLLNNKAFDLNKTKETLHKGLSEEMSLNLDEIDKNNEFSAYLIPSKDFYSQYIGNKKLKQNELNNYCKILEQAADKTKQTFFDEISNACGLVVVNEYFWGNKVFPHTLAEFYAKDFSTIHSNFVFACNFLTWNYNFDETLAVNNINFFHGNKQQENNQEDQKPLVQSYVQELKSTHMLENKTFYTLRNEIISVYNKSSYYQENDNFLRQNAFYYFGDKKDHCLLRNYLFFTQNVSTEICRDVVCGVRKDDVGHKSFHIIQSNTIPPNSDQLPSADIFIYCDPSVASVKDLNIRLSHVYKDTIILENICKPCYVASFDLVEKGFDVSIYKIIDNR